MDQAAFTSVFNIPTDPSSVFGNMVVAVVASSVGDGQESPNADRSMDELVTKAAMASRIVSLEQQVDELTGMVRKLTSLIEEKLDGAYFVADPDGPVIIPSKKPYSSEEFDQMMKEWEDDPLHE
ncbi:hypothetical protein IV102_18260 [bacterium]|nr:hypothetical protein [bacterium]